MENMETMSKKQFKVSMRKNRVSKQSTFMTHVLTPVVFATLLGACSGASDTLKVGPNPVTQNSNGSFNYSSCKGNDCVNTEFTLEPIENLNYSCSTTNNVTGVDSVMTCSADSEMAVFIQYPIGKRKIELGKLKIEAISQNGNAGKFLQRVSPVTLADPSAETVSQATRAINIVRLLDALGERPLPYNDQAPVNQMKIPDTYKANMDEFLTDDVSLKDFDDDTFITKTSDWLASHGKSVTLSKEDAKKRLERSLTVLNAGMYYQIPTLSGTSLGSNEQLLFDSGISITGTVSGDEKVNMAIFGLANREGATIGQGMHWQGNVVTNTQEFNLFRSQDFKRMRIIDPAASKFANITNYIQGYEWSAANVGVDDTTNELVESDADIRIDMSPKEKQGKLLRDFVMIGTNSLYETYFKSQNSDNSVLGKWTQTQVSINSTDVSDDNSSATILKFTPAQLSTFFDPAVWNSESVVAPEQAYVLPLHATMTFTYGQGNTNPDFVNPTGDNCSEDGCAFAKGKVGITILENGDIVTDSSSIADSDYVLGQPNCEIPTLVSGKYTNSDGHMEKRIGTIRATSQSIFGQSGRFINPSIMLSGAEFGELDGIHVGTRVASSQVTINLDGAINIPEGSTASVNMNDIALIDSNNQSSGLRNATWNNPYHFFTLLKIGYERESDSGYDLTPYQQKAVNQQFGEVSLSVSECYKVKEKPAE